MKKLFALILIAAIVCGMFAGCDSQQAGGSVTPMPEGDTAQQPTSGSSVAGKDVSMGAMEGGVYTNEYVGYGCKLDENWVFATAEELQQLPENVSELLADSELVDENTALTQFYDMQAENVTDLLSINVVYQKLDMATRAAYMLMTEERILDEVLKLKDSMISSYATAGIIATSIEKVQITFLGEERYALFTTASVGGTPYYILQLFDYHLGAYSVTTTLASYVENNTESMLPLFYAVD